MNFSEDVWDHLPPRLPSRNDRDRLAALAASGDPDAVRRLQIWDFFFQPEPKEVAQALRAEIWKQQQAADREQKSGEDRSRRLQKTLRNHVQASHEKVERLLREAAAFAAASEARLKQRSRSTKTCAVLGVLATIGGLVSMATGEPILALSGLGLLLGAVMLLVASAVLFLLFLDDRQKSAHAESKKTQAEEARAAALARTTGLEAEIEEAKRASRQRRRDLAESSRRLRALLDRLVGQLPAAVPAEQIDAYLSEDLKHLQSCGENNLGLLGRLANVDADNPVRILGPSEIQVAEAIPPTYLEEGSDKHKHLLAIRTTTLDSGRAVALLATFYVAFLYVGEKTLSIYRTFYDFVTGRSIGDVSTTYYYHDIVTIEKRNGYRPLRRQRGGSIDDAHSLRITLKDSQVIEITFPSDDYLEHAGVDVAHLHELDFHHSAGTGKAISALREYVAQSKVLEQGEYSVNSRDDGGVMARFKAVEGGGG